MLKQIICTFALYAVGAFGQSPLMVLHEGTPSGEIKDVNGVKVYHAYAPNKNNDNAILFLTDIFGMQLPQNRLYCLADSYARAGYLVLLPDYFKGDPIPLDTKDFNRTGWRDRHPDAEITSMIETTIKYARDTLKVKKLGATGFCFGGPYVVRQLAKNIDAGYIAHPGAFTNEELNAISGPLTIAAAEVDQSLNTTRRHEVEGLLTKKKATYQINLYSGSSHGFAVRVDMKDRRQVYAKETAFWQAVLWFDEWLKGGHKAPSSKFVANGHELGQESGNDLRLQHDFDYSY